jgi:hypothetical protein
MSRLKRPSKWTGIYMGTGDLENPWYIRLAPDFMDLSAAGFGHGLSISGNTFPTKEAACKAADLYDKFFDKMYEAIIEDVRGKQ